MAARITPKKTTTIPTTALRCGFSPARKMLSRKPKGMTAEEKGDRELTFSISRANMKRKVAKWLKKVEARVSTRTLLPNF